MRIYEIRKNGKPVGFARSFDLAKAIVKADDPSARKISNADLHYPDEVFNSIFSNGMGVHAIDIKPDKEGIISKLNSLIEESKPHEEDYFKPEPVQQVEEPINENDLKVETVVPAIAYKVDNMPFPKKGKGTCLHCKKEIGYVGGFPSVDPPDVICD